MSTIYEANEKMIKQEEKAMANALIGRMKNDSVGVFKKSSNGYCDKMGGECKYMTANGCVAYRCGRLISANVTLLTEKIRQAVALLDSIRESVYLMETECPLGVDKAAKK